MAETQPDVGNKTPNDSTRSRYYENVPELPRSFSAGGFNPINNQTSPTFQNYSEHSPRPVPGDSYFTPNNQNDASLNNTQRNVLTPEPPISAQQQHMEALRMQLPELPPRDRVTYHDPSPHTHRRSLDELTHLSFVGGEGRTNHVTPQNFVRQHRRGRSDEVARCFEGTPHMNRNIRFGSPPLPRAAPMTHSFSTSSIEQQQQLQQQQHHSHNFNHSLHHSASIDNATLYNSHLLNDNMLLYQQNTAYVELTTKINEAQRYLKDLEKGKEACEKELNDLLSVQNNPTEKDFRQLRDESTILHREIAEMYNECDKMNISIDPERGFTRQLPLPSTPLFRTPSPTKTQTMPMNRRDMNPMFPYSNGEHLTPVTKQPLPPNYRTISDPAPSYHTTLQPGGTRPVPDFYRSTSDVPRRPPPPVRPLIPLLRPTVPPTNFQPPEPRPGALAHSQEEDEHWECPSCTFKNLLVAECEVCYTRRPAKNVRLS